MDSKKEKKKTNEEWGKSTDKRLISQKHHDSDY